MRFNTGDRVSWLLLDGNLMCGTVIEVYYDTLYVRRVDGTVCVVGTDRCRLAVDGDVQEAVEFFTCKIGS